MRFRRPRSSTATSGWPGPRPAGFCLLNGRDLDYTVDDAEALVQAVARGGLDVAGIAALNKQAPALTVRPWRDRRTDARARSSTRSSAA